MSVASGWLNASMKGNKDLEGTRPPFHPKQWAVSKVYWLTYTINGY